MNYLTKNDDLGKLIIRLTLGLLLLFHGIAKVTNPGSIEFIKGQLINSSLTEHFVYGVYIGEILAPLLIIFGVLSRISALIIFVTMLFAIYLVHSHELFTLGQHGGWSLELQGFYLFTALAIIFLGSGKLAIKPD